VGKHDEKNTPKGHGQGIVIKPGGNGKDQPKPEPKHKK